MSDVTQTQNTAQTQDVQPSQNVQPNNEVAQPAGRDLDAPIMHFLGTDGDIHPIDYTTYFTLRKMFEKLAEIRWKTITSILIANRKFRNAISGLMPVKYTSPSERALRKFAVSEPDDDRSVKRYMDQEELEDYVVSQMEAGAQGVYN